MVGVGAHGHTNPHLPVMTELVSLAHRWELPLLQLSPSIVAWEGYEKDMGDALGFLDEPDGLAYLQPHTARVDREVYTFVGPALDRRPHQEQWPEPERPLLVVSLGSAYNDRPGFFRDVIAAMDGLDWQVAMSIGPHVDPADLGEVPGTVEVRSWLPQLSALRHASAFVTHAGMGGCSEGLYQGVPMVAVPQAVDQFGNAARLAELGVGEHLPAEEVTPQRLREAILRVSGSPEVARRCRELRAATRAAGGARAAADILESLLT